jgi:hypothetical protein
LSFQVDAGAAFWGRPEALKSLKTKVLLSAEAVEKANRLDHFIPDFSLHQSTPKYT